MMKKLVFGSCLAFSLFYGDCWGMDHTEDLESALASQTRIKEAIDKWSHLVPSGEVKAEIDDLLPQVLESRQKMEQLVTLICNPSNSSKFANYAHMVFIMVFPDCSDEERNKLGGMLAAIVSDKCGGGGASPSTYWSDYDSGYFDAFTVDDNLSLESWK